MNKKGEQWIVTSLWTPCNNTQTLSCDCPISIKKGKGSAWEEQLRDKTYHACWTSPLCQVFYLISFIDFDFCLMILIYPLPTKLKHGRLVLSLGPLLTNVFQVPAAGSGWSWAWPLYLESDRISDCTFWITFDCDKFDLICTKIRKMTSGEWSSSCKTLQDSIEKKRVLFPIN